MTYVLRHYLSVANESAFLLLLQFTIHPLRDLASSLTLVSFFNWCKPERESLKRTISAGCWLGALLMILEPDTKRSAREEGNDAATEFRKAARKEKMQINRRETCSCRFRTCMLREKKKTLRQKEGRLHYSSSNLTPMLFEWYFCNFATSWS